MSERLIKRIWSKPQTEFMRATARYVACEGAIRSGKSTALVWKIITYAIEYPGISMMLSRWTDDGLQMQLKKLFYDECPPEFLGRWHAREQCQDFRNGSRLYLRALKTVDLKSRYAKFSGLTLAVIGVDQPEEVPEDVMSALVGRLSQQGFPQQLLLTPNPPSLDHWLSHPETGWFPEGKDLKPDHQLIQLSVYDNRRHLGNAYIRFLEEKYPEGHPLRRRFIEGKRGLTVGGDAVYKGIFRRDLHVTGHLSPNYAQPLLESWDFGHTHPAVAWGQFLPTGALHIYDEFLGDNEFIDTFVPRVLARRQKHFSRFTEIWTCCDPSGADKGTQGMRYTPVDVLRDAGIFPRWVDASNTPPRRDYAIQALARLMLRLTKEGPSFQLHQRCAILADGFEAGYVWADRSRQHSLYPNIRVPLKDGYYDHLQNTMEYLILNFAPAFHEMSPLADPDDTTPEAFSGWTTLPQAGRGGY